MRKTQKEEKKEDKTKDEEEKGKVKEWRKKKVKRSREEVKSGIVWADKEIMKEIGLIIWKGNRREEKGLRE